MDSSKFKSDNERSGGIRGAKGIIVEFIGAKPCGWEMKKRRREEEKNVKSPVS